MTRERVEVPQDTSTLVLARKNAGMSNPSLQIDNDGNIVPRSSSLSPGEYTVTVRPSTRSGPREPSSRARSLKSCKGLKGCEFAKCAEQAFGKLPKHLEGLCSTDQNSIENKT